jgi:hypothetical protein
LIDRHGYTSAVNAWLRKDSLEEWGRLRLKWPPASGAEDGHRNDHHLPRAAEPRRPFVPTFWTITKGQQPEGHVEQTWFAGAHGNVGGGWADRGLSDQALIWMIARVHVLTGLEFDVEAVKSNTKPNVGGAVEDSTEGIWLLDHYFPHYRVIFAPVAIHHGYGGAARRRFRISA